MLQADAQTNAQSDAHTLQMLNQMLHAQADALQTHHS